MDPYDLPEEFSHLQAQDMSKLGFMQDLIRGIKKIAQADAPKTTVVKETVISGGNANTAPLLKRAFMFLEDGDWNSANEYCEKVLDIDPENAQAYLGKLLSELRVRKQETLKDQAEPFDHSNNYQKAIRFADEKLKTALAGYIEHINTRNENARLDSIYTRAKNAMSAANTESAYKEAAHLFESVSEYQDSAALAQSCYEKAEVARKNAILAEGKAKMSGEVISNYESAIKLFESISGWKDADEKIYVCQKKIEEIKAKEEAERLEKERQAEIARKKAEKIARLFGKIAIITSLIVLIVCVITAFFVVLNTVIIPTGKYNDAIALMDAGKYYEAITAFEALDEYKDSVTKIDECKYNNAIALLNAGNIVEGYEALIALDGYKDSADKASSIYDKYKVEKLKAAKVGDYVFFGAYEQDNNTSNGKEDIEWLVLAKEGNKALVISKYALDCQQYNTSYTDVTWETCTLRKWLNNDFLGAAFSADEKSMIPTVTVSADKNPDYSTNPGNTTQDQVFLLSITEANKYFSSDSARQCKPTEYAVAGGAYVNSSNGNCWWWLRSPGGNLDSAARVGNGGGVYEYGSDVDGGGIAVRPALWIDLNS